MPALAISYFGTDGTPKALDEVPIEIPEAALRWMASRVDAPVAFVGHSKGAELALVAASLMNHPVAAVIAWSPSCVAWYGLSAPNPMPLNRSSWSFRGQPVPFLGYPAGVFPGRSEKGMVLLPCYASALEKDPQAAQEASIAIERGCPTLLVSGDHDKMWPATQMAELLVRRAEARGGPIVKHLICPGAGHLISPDVAGQESTGAIDFGGVPVADKEGAKKSLDAALAFLRDYAV